MIIAELEAAVVRGDLSSGSAEMLAEARELADRLKEDCEDLIDGLEELLERGPDQEPSVAFQVVAAAQAAEEESNSALKKWPGRVWDKISAELMVALKRIWSMISKLLTVKEWTLNGQLSAEPFGLAQVGVSVTFGK